jgi:hypothetical protein
MSTMRPNFELIKERAVAGGYDTYMDIQELKFYINTLEAQRRALLQGFVVLANDTDWTTLPESTVRIIESISRGDFVVRDQS